MVTNTFKPAHNCQIRSQRKSTVRSRWLMKFFFIGRIKKKSA